MNVEVGKKYLYRDLSGQTFQVTVKKRFLFFVLLQWTRQESWDGTPPISTYIKTAWRPIWRIIE
jgi:hypothetical protein